MKHLPKIVFLIGALMLLLLFVFPLWRITLIAPQYPDGINMFIWVNKITGDTEFTLQNINILNHYIGMQYIEPDSIPELKYFPMVVIALVISGVVLAFVNNKKGFLAWTLILVILGILGIYDFYLWEYDYGHNLSPNAPIKVPGMVYQPPLFGSKMLLNFNAESYPHLGGLFLGLAMVFGIAAFWLKHKINPSQKEIPGKYKQALVCIFGIVIFSGCSVEPEAINYGQDACHYCKMSIVDQHYGAEIVNNKGKVYKFDAVECMLNHLHSDPMASDEVEFLLVTPYDTPGKLTDAKLSMYLHSEEMPSPMGMNLTAFSDQHTAKEYAQETNGQVYNWKSLNKNFKNKAWLGSENR